jgi:hypothetical protein
LALSIVPFLDSKDSSLRRAASLAIQAVDSPGVTWQYATYRQQLVSLVHGRFPAAEPWAGYFKLETPYIPPPELVSELSALGRCAGVRAWTHVLTQVDQYLDGNERERRYRYIDTLANLASYRFGDPAQLVAIATKAREKFAQGLLSESDLEKVIAALVRYRADSTDALLRQLLSDSIPWIRAAALKSMFDNGHPSASRPDVERLLQDADAHVRSVAESLRVRLDAEAQAAARLGPSQSQNTPKKEWSSLCSADNEPRERWGGPG